MSLPCLIYRLDLALSDIKVFRLVMCLGFTATDRRNINALNVPFIADLVYIRSAELLVIPSVYPNDSGIRNILFESFDKVGDMLEKASSSFGEAAGVLRGDGGKHSIVKKGKELEDLGVKLKKRLAVPKRFQCDENALENVPEVIEIDSGNAAEESNK